VAGSQQPEVSGHPRLANAHHDRDPSLSPDGHRALSSHRVFVGDEVLLDVSFPAARVRLASLIRGGLLGSASARAYGEGITGLAAPASLARHRACPGSSRCIFKS
jgi:hypothetical protein